MRIASRSANGSLRRADEVAQAMDPDMPVRAPHSAQRVGSDLLLGLSRVSGLVETCATIRLRRADAAKRQASSAAAVFVTGADEVRSKRGW